MPETQVASSRAELESALGARLTEPTTPRRALVPTMGALHEGHEALIRTARSSADEVVVSIFVNPLQFGPDEDLAAYPRTLDSDVERCMDLGVDVVFAPGVDVVYPGGEPQVTVDPGPLADELEGAVRPGHFRGVLTVVTKLFGLVRPDLAFFGTKDYQQLALVRRCVTDLSLPVEIVGVETVRAPDGLALSSRNRYLSETERAAAVGLSAALSDGRARAPDGPRAVLDSAVRTLEATPGVVTDYVALRGVDLGPAPQRGPARLLVAARVGTTRLIDNVDVMLVAPAGETGWAR